MNRKEDQSPSLFSELNDQPKERQKGKTSEHLVRLDLHGEIRDKIIPYCRLKYGDIWEDPVKGHRVGVLDATKSEDLYKITGYEKAKLIINDPPYNVKVGNANTSSLFKIDVDDYIDFSTKWVQNAIDVMLKDSHLYIWLGADYKDNFQPLPDFMIMMRKFNNLTPRNFITLRNQRGYGTQKNWMWIRQELLYYVKGKPEFNVVYTDIPKVLKGYYKTVDGKVMENIERSRSNTIRPANVWIDIQQVFYRLEENVSGCYAQKPIKAIDRLIQTSSEEDDIVLDFFSHSGTTLIVAEMLNRRALTFDIDPIFSEITIRRLENFRKTGKTGWQWGNPFPELEEA
ncbi:MAG: site-specific DNA-methyltransferase [Spirochaetota bacterium]|nr:site-specific DNA-methyltransferase [Spirochaetota bacterium]